MRILEVIHGFPPYYMAGSEVYAYTMSRELSKFHDVYVFSRIENPFLEDYKIIKDKGNKLSVFRVNKPGKDYSLSDKYLDEKIDNAYRTILKKVAPDVVHIQHLSHLSTNIVNITKEEFKKPIVFTVHDFWMFCIRGQLLTREYKICKGPDIKRCARCLNYLHTNEREITEYRKHMGRVLNNIDVFLTPSNMVRDFYIKMGIPASRVIYSPYGFDKTRIHYKKRRYGRRDKITFGFVGRIIPPKGVHVLINAFSSIENKRGSKLKIYGEAGKYKEYLKGIGNENIYFMGGFDNKDIDGVLDDMDVLVVPSIWYENSPLVIQEAFLKGVPVIASDIGGMKELVKNGVDGYLFKMGDANSLKEVMERIIEEPAILNDIKLNRDRVRSIEDDIKSITKIFGGLIYETA